METVKFISHIETTLSHLILPHWGRNSFFFHIQIISKIQNLNFESTRDLLGPRLLLRKTLIAYYLSRALFWYLKKTK